ncbi:MAG: hypothetical protein AAGD35_17115 [Actinomycetota bacterium]
MTWTTAKGAKNSVRIGVELRPEGAHIALVDPKRPTVVGLGIARYPLNTVIDGELRQPLAATESIRRLLDGIHFSTPPPVVVAVGPAGPGDPEGLIEAPVLGRGRMGTARARSVEVEAARLLLDDDGRYPVAAVDSAPVAALRFAVAITPTSPPVFARSTFRGNRWTAYLDNDHVEVETSATARTAGLRIGPDLATMRPPTWGRLRRSRPVAAAHRRPGPFTVAVGAALLGLGRMPTLDLAAPGSHRIVPLVGARPVLRVAS